MTELTLKLIIILIPGAIATLVFGKLILHKEWSNFRFVLYSILFGIFSYLILQGIIFLVNYVFPLKISNLTIWNSLTDTNKIPYSDVFYASIISVIFAFLMSYIENKKWINKIAKFLNVSYKYGEENLYSRFLNDPEIDFIYLRDIKNNLVYYGWVKSFSENNTISEIRLGEVSVYTNTESDLLYEIEEVYLSLNKNEIIIEKAILTKEKENGKT